MSLIVGLTPYCDIESIKNIVKPDGLLESYEVVRLSSVHDVELLSRHLLTENSSLIIIWSRFERLFEVVCDDCLGLDEHAENWLLIGQSLDRFVRRHRDKVKLMDMGQSSNHFRWIAKSFLRENPAYYQIESRLLASSVNLIQDSMALSDPRLDHLISFIADQSQSSVNYAEDNSRLMLEIERLKASVDEKNTQVNEIQEENSLIISELHRVQEAFEEALTIKNTLVNKAEKLKREFEALAKSKVYLERRLMLIKSNNSVKSPLQKFKKSRQAIRQSAIIESSDYFDAKWYLEQYKDVAEHKRFSSRPALHYITLGGFEGRNPSPRFNSEAYLMANQDVLRKGFNPLFHYIMHGKKEGRPLR